MIQRITFEDWKGLRQTSELGPLTLLTGPNGSGKSAHLQAIQYAIQGDTPAGATAEAAMGYMGPNGGAVRLDFDGGLTVRRGILRDAKELTLSTDVSISTMPGAAAKATCAEISLRCGDFAPMHDLGAFLGLSADKRREYLLALCGAAATAEGFDVLGQIRAEFLRDRQTLSEGEDAALEWLLADLVPIATAALSPADAVGKVAERIKARISETKAAAERARAAGLEMSARKNTIHVAAVSIEELTRRRTQAASEREGMIAQLNRQRGKAGAIESLQRTLAHPQTELREAQRELIRLNCVAFKTAEAAEWEAEAARLEASAIPPAWDGSPVDAELRALADETAQVGGRIRAAEADIHLAECDMRTASAGLVQIAGSAWTRAIQLLKALTDELPASLLDGSAAYENLFAHLRKMVGGDATAHESSRDAAQARLLTAQGVLDALRLQQADIEARYAASRKAEYAARAAYTDAAAKSAGYAQDARRLRDAAKRVTDGVRERDRATARLDASCTGLAEAITQAEAEIANLTADLSAASMTDLSAAVAEIDSTLADLDASVESKRTYETLDRELAAMILDLDRQMTRHEVAKSMADACRVSRETLMAQLVAPLMNGMTRFLAGTGLPVVPYCRLESDRGKPLLELGWVRDGRVRVALPTMSGGECGLFHAALAYALVAIRRPPVRLLMIEAGELDVESLSRLALAVGAVADSLDNAIVATHLEVDPGDGWTAIECGEREAVTA